MTGIEGIGWPTAPRVTRRSVAKPGFFVRHEATATGKATAAAPPQPTTSGSILTLQELGDETVADREARRHGLDMLTTLAELQKALLSDTDQQATLQRLSDLAAAIPCATDRRLAALVSAILVRVRVELARRQKGSMSGR